MAEFTSKIRAWHCGLAAALTVAAVFLFGWLNCGENAIELGLAAVVSLVVGLVISALFRAKAYAWLVTLSIGLFFGLESAVELLWEVPFDRQYFIALVTALFWLALFFAFGAIAEFIRSLHRLAHKIGQGVEDRLREHMAERDKGRRTRE